ncbi:helix-turn-helix transcriptional regulator [Allokutzneria oryzae]|uniref:Response regulator transcription factor n=1 Tax=Allokutzneria oryzae TaxID=1378989 RepID=A0ABV5ZS47_9PSEU
MTTDADPTVAGTWLSTEALELYRRIVLDPGSLGVDTGCGRGDDPTAAITQLADVGLIRPAPGSGWEAVNPGLAVDTLMRQAQTVLTEHRHRISALGHSYNLLHRAFAERTTSSALFEPVADEHEAHTFLSDHLRASPNDVFACSAGPGTRFADSGVDAVLTPRLIPPGRHLHLVVPAGPTGSALHAAFAAERRVRLRTCRQVPVTAVIVGDRAGAVVLPQLASGASCTPHSARRQFYVYEHPGAHALVKSLLDSLWSFSDQACDQVPPCSGIQRSIVRLLAMGKKDEHIARELGVGLRTARKHIANILTALGARSRFEAGVLIERHGWLDKQTSD